jgi:hypothetical protein
MVYFVGNAWNVYCSLNTDHWFMVETDKVMGKTVVSTV